MSSYKFIDIYFLNLQKYSLNINYYFELTARLSQDEVKLCFECFYFIPYKMIIFSAASFWYGGNITFHFSRQHIAKRECQSGKCQTSKDSFVICTSKDKTVIQKYHCSNHNSHTRSPHRPTVEACESPKQNITQRKSKTKHLALSILHLFSRKISCPPRIFSRKSKPKSIRLTITWKIQLCNLHFACRSV